MVLALLPGKILLVALFPSSKASFLPMRGLDSPFGGYFHNVGGGASFSLCDKNLAARVDADMALWGNCET